ncbi:PH domain-containing protein [Bifidobacterium thermacidophilum]|uniref:PH domain-containing protein n=1 Tax=Bifidobacterium thermacidophilum TaxID=246618 RepID=UPI003F09ECBA
MSSEPEIIVQPNQPGQAGSADSASQTDPVNPTLPSTPAGGRPAAGYTEPWHRQSPIVLVIDVYRIIRDNVVQVLAFIGLALHGQKLLWLALAALLVVGDAVFRVTQYVTTRYRFTSDALQLRSGLINRSNRELLYARIHAVNGEQNMLLRPFGLTDITVSDASDAKDAIVLRAVPRQLVEQLEERRKRYADHADAANPADRGTAGIIARPVSASTSETTPESAPVSASAPGSVSGFRQPSSIENASQPTLVYRAQPRDLLVYALTDLGILAAVAVVYGLYSQLEDIVPDSWKTRAQSAAVSYVSHGVMFILALLLVLWLLLAVVSVIRTMLRFYGFEVWRAGSDLVIRKGLITKTAVTIPVARIQSVSVERSLLRRLCGLVSVSVGLSSDLAGASQQDEETISRVIPVIGEGQAFAALRVMMPQWRWDAPAFTYTARTHRWFMLRWPLRVGVIAIVVAAGVNARVLGWGLPGIMLMVAVVGVIGLWLAFDALKIRVQGFEDGTMLPDRRLVVQTASLLTVRTLFTKRHRVQSVQRSGSVWMLRKGFEQVTLLLYIADDPMAVALDSVDAPVADALVAHVVGAPVKWRNPADGPSDDVPDRM